MTKCTHLVLMLLVVAVVIGWVALNEGEHAATARLFLKNLLRQLF